MDDNSQTDSYGVSLVFLKAFISAGGINPYIAQLGGIMFYSVTFFIGYRVFVFTPTVAAGRVSLEQK